jgi:hypothetical protein
MTRNLLSISKSVVIWKKFQKRKVFQIGFPTSTIFSGFSSATLWSCVTPRLAVVGSSLLPRARRYKCHQVPTAPLSEATPEVAGPKQCAPPLLSKHATPLRPAFADEPRAAATPELPRRPVLRSPSSFSPGAARRSPRHPGDRCRRRAHRSIIPAIRRLPYLCW